MKTSVLTPFSKLKEFLGREFGSIAEALKLCVMPQFDFSHLEVSLSGDREREDFKPQI